MRRILTLLACLWAWPALGQNYWPSPTAGFNISGAQHTCLNGSGQSVPCGDVSNPLVVTVVPVAITPLTASAVGTTAAITATLAGVAAKTTYICGFNADAGATLGGNGAATVAGTISGTLNYVQGIGVLAAIQRLTQNYSPCIPASAANTSIVITTTAAGLGGTAAVSAWGYQQ